MNTAATRTKPFALISHERAGRNAQIIATGSEATMLARHAETPFGTGTFYSVRPLDHELAQMAARQMADRLTAKQQKALADLEADRRRYGRTSVRPGYEMNRRSPTRWIGMDSYSLAQVTRSQKLNGLLHVRGVPYGPKTYTLTSIGRAVATEVLNRNA
jgi:hypothetical protein